MYEMFRSKKRSDGIDPGAGRRGGDDRRGFDCQPIGDHCLHRDTRRRTEPVVLRSGGWGGGRAPEEPLGVGWRDHPDHFAWRFVSRVHRDSASITRNSRGSRNDYFDRLGAERCIDGERFMDNNNLYPDDGFDDDHDDVNRNTSS